MSAAVTSLHVWSADSQVPTRVDQITLDFSGVEGDRHYGRTMRAAAREAHAFARGTKINNYRQISIVDTAELAKIAANLGINELEPGTKCICSKVYSSRIREESITHGRAPN